MDKMEKEKGVYNIIPPVVLIGTSETSLKSFNLHFGTIFPFLFALGLQKNYLRTLFSIITYLNTPFAVHYEKIRIHLRELTTNSAKMHS